MKKIMFGNSLMLLALVIIALTGLKILYVGFMWAAFVLVFIGFLMAIIGFFSKDN